MFHFLKMILITFIFSSRKPERELKKQENIFVVEAEKVSFGKTNEKRKDHRI